MIDASTVRCIQEKQTYELHMRLCAKIEQAVVNAAMASFNELLVHSHSAITECNSASIRLEAYAYDIERLQFVLKNAGYEVEKAAYTDSFIIKW